MRTILLLRTRLPPYGKGVARPATASIGCYRAVPLVAFPAWSAGFGYARTKNVVCLLVSRSRPNAGGGATSGAQHVPKLNGFGAVCVAFAALGAALGYVPVIGTS
jgi:hypothetical protein